ncbi:hypothetical protein F5Y18DRAFT_111232 [Xylariaceae sp. FL1019]|nr:hypothetical protein F5Y18DRAFT_111232 [Xylariaceae sp. FL1019]
MYLRYLQVQSGWAGKRQRLLSTKHRHIPPPPSPRSSLSSPQPLPGTYPNPSFSAVRDKERRICTITLNCLTSDLSASDGGHPTISSWLRPPQPHTTRPSTLSSPSVHRVSPASSTSQHSPTLGWETSAAYEPASDLFQSSFGVPQPQSTAFAPLTNDWLYGLGFGGNIDIDFLGLGVASGTTEAGAILLDGPSGVEGVESGLKPGTNWALPDLRVQSHENTPLFGSDVSPPVNLDDMLPSGDESSNFLFNSLQDATMPSATSIPTGTSDQFPISSPSETYEQPQSSSSSSNKRRSPPVDHAIALKRQRNNVAARKYRQKRIDRIVELETELEEVKQDRDDLRLRLARQEAETAALRTMLGMKSGEAKS